MAKKWIDANLIADADLVPNELWEYEDEMKKKPNFDKKKGRNNFKIKKDTKNKEGRLNNVYEKQGYIILKAKNGYIAYNTKKEFDKGHTHLYSFNMAKTIIDNCVRKNKPKTKSLYLLNSHIRLSKDDKYINFIEEVIKAKKANKKLKYVNSNNSKGAISK